VFIKNTYYDGFDSTLATSTATSTTLSDGSLADRFTHIVRLAIEKLTNVFLDMTLWVKNINADKVQTKQLCIDDVCVTKSQLQQMIQNSGNNSNSQNNSQVQNPPADNSTTTDLSATSSDATTTPPVDTSNSTTTPPTDNSTTTTP
jgi:hypothetical protein